MACNISYPYLPYSTTFLWTPQTFLNHRSPQLIPFNMNLQSPCLISLVEDNFQRWSAFCIEGKMMCSLKLAFCSLQVPSWKEWCLFLILWTDCERAEGAAEGLFIYFFWQLVIFLLFLHLFTAVGWRLFLYTVYWGFILFWCFNLHSHYLNEHRF